MGRSEEDDRKLRVINRKCTAAFSWKHFLFQHRKRDYLPPQTLTTGNQDPRRLQTSIRAHHLMPICLPEPGPLRDCLFLNPHPASPPLGPAHFGVPARTRVRPSSYQSAFLPLLCVV